MLAITEVKIKIVPDNSERLLAFASMIIDGCFCVRDLKVIEGVKGLFVAMPSRKISDKCGRCGHKNHLLAKFCNHCGARLLENRAARDKDGRPKLHADVSFPINSACRQIIQAAVSKAFEHERELSRQPGYVCTYEDAQHPDHDDEPPSYGQAVRDGGPR